MPDRSPSTEAFRQAALAVSTAEGEHVFEQLVTSLARILGVEFALISVYVEPQRTMLRTLATFFNGRLARNIEYPIAGTPCEQAIGRTFGFYPKGVAKRFPGDGVLTQSGVEGYAATTLHDSDGSPIGALTVMSRGEMADAALTEAMLNIFAARVSAEIGRRRSEASYRAVFESAETAIFLHDIVSGAIVDANPKACAVYGYSAEELGRLSVDELSSGIPPYTGDEARRHFERARAGEVVRGEWQRRNKDGSLHWDEVTLKRVEISGRPHIMAATREITERKVAEEALRASEEQYRAIFNATTDSLTLRDADFRIVDVNATYERMSGLRREDVLGMAELTVDVLDVKDWRRDVHERVLKGEAMRIESDARRRDGTLFRVEVLAVPMQYRGAPHALLVARDITARKRADEALRASEAQYRAIFNAAADALALRDAEFRVVDVNAAYEAMTGRQRAEVIGQVGQTITDDDKVDRFALHARALAGEPVRIETEGRRPDGTPLVLEVRGVSVTHRGAPHVLYMGRDITARRAAEGALRASEEQYRAIFNAMADGLTLRDADFRVVEANPAYARMTGYALEEIIGSDMVTTLSLRDREFARALHARALAGEPVHIESQAVRKDGTLLDCEIYGVPMSYRGAPHVLYIGRDITARKAAEGALRSSEEQYRAIFNATDDALVLRDAAFRIVDVNAAYEAISGKRREEVAGLTDLTLTRNARIIDRRALHEQALAGQPVFFEADGWRQDGTPFVLEVRGVPMSYKGEPHVLYIGRDATEAKLAERALRSSEEQYRAIFNATADALVLRDADFRIVDVNAAYEAMSGRRREEVAGLTDLTLTHNTRIVDRRALHARALAGEAVFFETDGVRPDGSPLVLEVRGLPISYRGEPHVLYIGRDATEAKLAERALRSSEEQYRAIFNAAADALMLRDADYRVVEINPAYEALSGLAREEVLGATRPVLGLSEHEEERMALHRRALEGERLRLELDSERRDGSRFRMELQIVPMQYRGVPHVLYVGRDITERRQAEEALRASWEQYRAIFDATTDSHVLRDAEFRIVDVNPAYEAMSGRTRAEALGRRDVTMSDPARTARIMALHQRALAGEQVRWESVARRKNGEAFHIEVRGVPIRHQGQPHVLYIGRDVTEAKAAEAGRAQLEAQLRQAQKMEAIGQLTGGIAHDFNNILQGVLGNLVLAEERQEELADAKLGRYLERAHAASQRARDLIQQMLTFSRGKSGERRPVAAAELLGEATRLLRPTLPATIELHTELAPDLPPALLDAVQFEQVLLNLCINARDAMQGVGRIALAVRLADAGGAYCASCRQRVDGRFLELSVRDTGPGIVPEVLDRMFDPFFSTKEVGKGSGMGLAMVHGIVHQHGGHVLVDSSPGAGTLFRVLVPPAAEPAQAAAGRETGRARKARALLSGRVLIADDEAAIRELLEDLLVGWGLEVVACADGAAARDAFAEDPQGFDLVLTDQTMPRLTGLQLAKLVTRMRPGIPVILCTGYGEDLKKKELEAAGVRTLAKKPCEPAELRELVQAALQTRNKAPT